MVVDTAKHAVVVAEEVKNKAEVAEEEAKDAVTAMREAEATEAVEAASWPQVQRNRQEKQLNEL